MTLTGTMPDVTPAQILALLTWIVSQAVAYGWLDVRYQQIVLSVGATLLAIGWKLADSWLRTGRAKAVAVNPALANLTTKTTP